MIKILYLLIVATCSESDETFITQELEVLTNLILNMIVLRIFLLKNWLKSIHLVQSKVSIPYFIHTSHDIHHPTTTINITCHQSFETTIIIYHYITFPFK